MQRREFLKAGLAASGGLLVSNSIWARVFADPVAGDRQASGYGALGDPDPTTGIQTPPGFTSREIARANTPVPGTAFPYPVFPDGAYVFEADRYGDANLPSGGWILVVNSESPPGADFPFLEDVQDTLGGASAVVFDAGGEIVDAYRVLSGTRTNCAGGFTPWGTWLSCEEFDETEHVPADAPPPLAQSPGEAGRVWECDPTRPGQGVPRPDLGHFKHEAAAFDLRGRVYLTEDIGDGCVYRYTPRLGRQGNQPGSLDGGTLEALKAEDDGTVSWVPVHDPRAQDASTRHQAQALGATVFDGGEGCWFAPKRVPGAGEPDTGIVYFTTKGDDKVWAHDVGEQTLEVVYPNPQVHGDGRLLNGVDNIIVSPHTGHIYVAEDGDTMEVVVIEQRGDGQYAAPMLRFTGPQHGLVGQPNPTPIPLESEVTSISISPDGRRMYVSSQREAIFGATYEVRAPAGATF